MPTTINPSGQTITQHAVQIGGSNNLLTQLTPGAAGTVVTSNGASADPSYQAPIIPGSVWISTNYASAGNYIITLPGTYYSYALNFVNLFPISNGDFTQMFVSLDNGVTYLTSYQSGVTKFTYNSSTPINYNSTTSALISGHVHSSGVGNGTSGTIYISVRGGFDYVGNCTYCDTSAANAYSFATFGGTVGGVVTVPTTLKITSPTSGQISFGFVYLYGLTQ